MIQLTETIHIPETEYDWSYARSGGPGGQNVNKVASKAVLRWKFNESTALPEAVRTRFLARFGQRVTVEGDIVIASDRYRDQPRNRDDCVAKLSAMIAAVLTPPKPRKATKPSKGSKVRRLAAKKRNATTKAGRRSPGSDD